MRNVVLWTVALSLALGACGNKEPAAPAGEEPVVTSDDRVAKTPEGTPAPVAGTPADADPATGGSPLTPRDPGTDGKPAKEKGGDEEFHPPSNWCGTPTMPVRRPIEPGKIFPVTIVLFKNKAGEVLRVEEKALTRSKRKSLHEQGWRETGRLTEWKMTGGPK